MDVITKKTVLETIPFKVEEMTLRSGEKTYDRPWHRLLCPDWVNVLPVTADRRAILIRQPRAGVLKSLLECPGGVIDAHERDPTLAAVRELEEETGFTSQRVLPLGSLYANPAIMNNKTHFFLALNCTPALDRKHHPDPDEEITVELHDVATLDTLVRTGQVDHALCALCIMLAGKYLGQPG